MLTKVADSLYRKEVPLPDNPLKIYQCIYYNRGEESRNRYRI